MCRSRLPKLSPRSLPGCCWFRAWARRGAILWAVLPPAAIGDLDRLVSHTSDFTEMLKNRVDGPQGSIDAHSMTSVTPAEFCLALRACAWAGRHDDFLGLAVQVRKYRGRYRVCGVQTPKAPQGGFRGTAQPGTDEMGEPARGPAPLFLSLAGGRGCCAHQRHGGESSDCPCSIANANETARAYLHRDRDPDHVSREFHPDESCHLHQHCVRNPPACAVSELGCAGDRKSECNRAAQEPGPHPGA